MVSRIPSASVFSDPHLPLSIRRIERHFRSPDPHGHEFQELVVIVGGWGRHRVGAYEYEIRAGETFVLTGEMTHHYPDARDLSLINVLFDAAALRIPDWDLGEMPGYHALFEIEPRMRQVGAFRNRVRLDLDELAHVINMVREIEAELEGRQAGYRFLALAQFRRLIGYLVRRYSADPGDGLSAAAQLSRVLSHIERHHSDALTVADFCRAGRCSRSTLMRKFRAVTGLSPIEYLIRHRIGRAQRLLRQTDLAVTEIGLQVGFCDGNYFSRQFRRVTGFTPSQWRQSPDKPQRR